MTEIDKAGSWRAEVFLETRWQRSDRVDQAWFPDEQSARAWVAAVLERLRVHGELLGGEDAVCYLAEVRNLASPAVPPAGLVSTAYLLDAAGQVEWEEWDEIVAPH